MTKMSFASVYRTAAILAAFSRGDVPADEPTRREEPSPRVVDFGLPLRRNATLAHILRIGWARVLRRHHEGVSHARWNTIDPHAIGWWVLQRRPVVPLRPEAQGSPLVSHFAFSETADLHSVESGL